MGSRSASSLESSQRRVRATLVLSAVDRLPWEIRDVVVRVYFHGQTLESVASHLGAPPRTVARRLLSGLRQIDAAVLPQLVDELDRPFNPPVPGTGHQGSLNRSTGPAIGANETRPSLRQRLD
jgi:hypothetical protein